MRRPGATNPLLSRLALKILAILVLCGVLPSLLAALHLLQGNRTILSERVMDTLTTQLDKRTAEIDTWMGDRMQDATRWSASFVVFEGVEALVRSDPNAARGRDELRDYLGSVLGHYPVYESLFIVGRNGDVLAATRREELERWGRDFVHDPGVDRGVVSPILRSETLGRPTLLVLFPIQGRAGATLGYLVERIDLREFERQFLELQGDLQMSFWYLDASGRVQVKESRLVESEAGDPPQPLVDAEPGPSVREARLPGVGEALFCVGALKPPLGGKIVLSVSKDKALASLTEARTPLIRFALPGAIVLLLAFTWAVRGLLRPILLLSEGARRLSAGDLNIYLPVRGRDEIAGLTAAFNEMTRRLRDGRIEIEEAHDELARANQGLRAANRTLETLAITDGLTGLYNHRHFQDTLDKELRRCDRENHPLSLLMIDIDHFKQFNDQWGHTEGDTALRRVAGQIMKSVRATDTAFRYGGEEIAALLPGCMKEQARDVAEKIRNVIGAHPVRGGRSGATLTVSLGVATAPEDGYGGRALVDAADAALYAAKARGRNCVVLAGPAATGVGAAKS